jgi:SET domain-containing protein
MSFASKAGRSKKMQYKLIQPSKVYVDKSKIKGRGVFAAEDIDEGELIEQCHFIVSGCMREMQDKELARFAFNIFFDTSLSKEENEKISFKIRLLSMFEDEEITEHLKNFLQDLGYADINKLFNSATVLGNGMIYNHAKNNNINYEVDVENMMFEYTANKEIKKGEELLINYGEQYWKNHEGTTTQI